MIRILFLITTIIVICVSCGKKDNPVYKSYYNKNNIIHII